jgi:hypothetical protein
VKNESLDMGTSQKNDHDDDVQQVSDGTSRPGGGPDKAATAAVIKRLKQASKEDTNRFDNMTLEETLERLEASERVAVSVDAALAVETNRKRALLTVFIAKNVMTPARQDQSDETPTQNVSLNVSSVTSGDMTHEDKVTLAKKKLAETQANSRQKLALAKSTRAYNETMAAELEKRGIDVPQSETADM